MKFFAWCCVMVSLLITLSACAQTKSPATAPASRADWVVDVARGTAVHRGVLGHTWEFQLQSPLKGHATVMRGVAGGLAAENFDWRVNARKQSGGKWNSTLAFLRDCRDNGWSPVITANLRGLIKPGSGGTFDNVDPDMLAQLAADWVRYCNFIVHTYRQGDAIESPDDRRIVESLRWEGEDVLLKPGEPLTPRVDYWEIGNEPSAFAGNLPGGKGPHVFTHRPGDYVHRYKTITAAMTRVDPAIKVGPCFADDFRDLDRKPYVMAVLSSDARIDFVSYHKYAHLMHAWPDEGGMLNTLQNLRREMDDRHARAVDALRTAGRDPAKVELSMSEYNAASWGVNSVQFSMARAIGTAIYIHQFVEHGYAFANHWDRLAFEGNPWPAALLMQRYVRDLPGVFIGRFRDDSVDLIATRDATNGTVTVWGFNLDPRQERAITIQLDGATRISSAERSVLSRVSGRSSLLDRNTPVEPDAVRWSELASVPTDGRSSVELRVPAMSVTQWTIRGEMPAARIEPQPQLAPSATSRPATVTRSELSESPVASAKNVAARLDAGRIVVSWERSGGSDVTAQVVERMDDAIEFHVTAELDANATSYEDRAVEPGGTYQYRIVTRTKDARSGYSSIATASVPLGGATTRRSAKAGASLGEAKLIGHWPFSIASGLKSATAPEAASKAVGPAKVDRVDGREALVIEKGGYAELSDPPTLAVGPGREGAIAFWIRTTDTRGVVLARNESHDGPAGYEYGVLLDPPGRVRWMSAVHVRGFKSQIGASGTPVADGRWHHVAITFKDTTGRFYVDGVPAGEFDSLEWNVPLKHGLLIGANRTWRPDMVSPGIAMAISDLRFYDRMLSVDAVKELAAK